MPPKKGGKAAPTEEVADLTVAPEHEDDRSIVITIRGLLSPRPSTAATDDGTASAPPESPGFAAALYQPAVSLHFPQTDAAVASAAGIPEGFVARPDTLTSSDREFSLTVYSRKLSLNPALVAQLLGGSFRAVATCQPEPPKDAPPAAGAPPAKGGKGKGAAKGGQPGTARSEQNASEAIELVSHRFTLAPVLTGKTSCDVDLGFVNGFDSLSITIAVNAPLLGPSNVLRYPAAIVTVCNVSQLPPKGAIDPNRHVQTISGSLNATAAARAERDSIASKYEGVMIKAKWTAGGVVDMATRRQGHDSTVDFDETFIVFLHAFPKLAVLQTLFEDSIDFEVHDRDPKDPAPRQPAAPFGVARVSLREALNGNTRFIDTTQVVPCRAVASAALPDYYSHGTALHTKVTLTAPLPFLTFVPPPAPASPSNADLDDATGSPRPAAEVGAVNADDGPITEQCVRFLSRVTIVMPYRSEVTAHVISGVMGVLVHEPRPTPGCDVAEVPIKKAPPPPTDEKPAKGGKGGKGKAEEVVEEPQSPTILEAAHPAGGRREQLLVTVPDNVSGFEVMDGEMRLIVIEAPLPFIAKAAAVAAAVAGDDSSVQILFNYELPFVKRRYHTWPPLVRPIMAPSVVAEAEAAKAAAAAAAAEAGSPDSKKGGKGAGASKPPGSSRSARPAVPPIGGTPDTAAASSGPGADVDDDDEGEMDAGGVGGRIRRIRLKQTLAAMYNTKSHYIRRSMPHDALVCIHRLVGLAKSPCMLHALDHDLFPSAAEIIALERIAGDCLDVYDVCAADDFYNFGERDVSELVEHATQMQLAAVAERERPPADEMDLGDLDMPGSMGRVVSFVAVPTPPDEVRRLPTLATIKRYTHTGYLTEIERKVPVRCAFSTAPPTQLLRFLVTGQVVPDGGGKAALFVMSCVSLAKKGTDSRNPAFVAKKRADEHKLPASAYYAKRREAAEQYKRTHTQPNAFSRKYQDESSDDEDGFEDGAPYSASHDTLGRIQVAERDAETNHVGLGRQRLHEQSKVAAAHKLQAARALDAKYARAIELDEKMYQKDVAEWRRLAALRPQGGPAFTTLNKRSAVDDAKPKLAPSESRVDDLKAPWVAPEGSLFVKKQGESHTQRLRFDGGANATATTFESVFAENAKDKAEREAEDKRRAKEDWERKVVVDDPQFRVACKNPQGPPHVIDKHRTMLDGEPKKASLKKVRMVPAPVSIREVEKVVPNERVDPKHAKHPHNRQFYYARDAHDKIPHVPGMDESEKRGPLWYPPAE